MLVPAIRSSERGAQRWLPLAEGAVGVTAGLLALPWPGMTVSGLHYVITGWALLTGVLKTLPHSNEARILRSRHHRSPGFLREPRKTRDRTGPLCGAPKMDATGEAGP